MHKCVLTCIHFTRPEHAHAAEAAAGLRDASQSIKESNKRPRFSFVTRPVEQVCAETQRVLRQFDSLTKAARHVGNTKCQLRRMILSCCHVDGSYFRYSSYVAGRSAPLKVSKEKVSTNGLCAVHPQATPVEQVCAQTKQIVRQFPSLSKAAAHVGRSKSGMITVISRRQELNGSFFRYSARDGRGQLPSDSQDLYQHTDSKGLYKQTDQETHKDTDTCKDTNVGPAAELRGLEQLGSMPSSKPLHARAAGGDARPDKGKEAYGRDSDEGAQGLGNAAAGPAGAAAQRQALPMGAREQRQEGRLLGRSKQVAQDVCVCVCVCLCAFTH